MWKSRSQMSRLRHASPKHRSQTAADYERAQHRILILGAGFGGLSVARDLDRWLPQDLNASVLVVDRTNSLLFTPLLWTVADGRSAPSDVAVPIRAFQRGKRFHVLQAKVSEIDLEQRVVHTAAGARHYDTLVLALGSHTALPHLPGVDEHARIFATPANALELRNRLIDAIEAAHNTTDSRERSEWLTFVICGGGDTGIELSAVISTYLRSGLFAEYPWLATAPVRVVVVGRAERLVPMSDPKTSQTVREELERQGIEVQSGVSVEGITDRAVKTSAGEIPTRTVFWAAGITAPPVIRALPVAHARNGSLMVNDSLRLPDHPEVYVVGDCAWAYDAMTSQALPPTAQAAEHMGAYVARHIGNTLSGQATTPFSFEPRGHLALLGQRTGVGSIGPITVKGLPAWLLWHAYYLSHIPSWRNRLHLTMDWLFSGIAGRVTSELRLDGDRDVTQTQSEPSASSQRTPPTSEASVSATL